MVKFLALELLCLQDTLLGIVPKIDPLVKHSTDFWAIFCEKLGR